MTTSRSLMRPLDTRVRARRIDVLNGMTVESRTLGAPMVFNLTPDNLSRTGILLGIGKYKKVPYQLNTILELTVDPRGAVFERPVQCLGKVVRVTTVGDETPAFGVHIVQMDAKDVIAWETTVAAMEAGQHAD
jgi:hypothetical protein